MCPLFKIQVDRRTGTIHPAATEWFDRLTTNGKQRYLFAMLIAPSANLVDGYAHLATNST